MVEEYEAMVYLASARYGEITVRLGAADAVGSGSEENHYYLQHYYGARKFCATAFEGGFGERQ